MGWRSGNPAGCGGFPDKQFMLHADGIGMASKSIKDFLVGALVGIVSMMPGASGGIIAVIFGVYERLIADLADIRHKLLKDLRFIIPLGLGIALGLLVCAVGIDALLQRWEIPMMFLFVALIAFQIPDIMKLANGDSAERPTQWNWTACIVGAVVMVLLVIPTIMGGSESSISLVDMNLTNVVLLFVIGVVLALSKIVPGMSGAAILLAIGLYTPLMDLVGGLDMSIIMDRISAIIVVGIGVIVGALALSKVVDWFIENHRRSTYYCILGMTLGSVVAVVIQALYAIGDSGVDAGLAAGIVIGIVAGLLIGYAITKVSSRYAEETIEGEVRMPSD